MSAKNLQNFLQSLSETAFVRIDGDRYRWDPLKGKGALRQELPWQIQTWEIDAQNGEVNQSAFAIRLNAEHFLLNLEDGLKARFPSFRKATLEADKKGGFWLLVEFLDPALDADQSRLIENDEVSAVELPHGLATLHLSIIQAVGQVSIFMTRHCLIGNTPGPFFIELPKLLNQALFGVALHEKTNFNSYLLTLKSDELRSALIEYCRLSESAQQLVTNGGDRAFGQIKLAFEGKNWKLTWISGEETPELLVPPMEILEQKEVARRFQRLDELILLEDYQGALDQCRDYLDKNPQSLYLVRRWAFLTLWANLPFERKYLDLMTKYDPQNLMTLSLSVRDALASGHSDSLLENLSKLGSNLGQSVADFDSLDITSLTLPEMLGDAWNHKDDQRAVSCYERVLSARGEIPRILVKLIRLMRDIEDSTAEESYMDRLLACEVPTRTRAAIYYRLAEIKQKVDPADACQWALKSWHTHRMQVRYAVLAADLLIELGRPHDAVHVLVETSEILEGNTSESRIGLELKIASIWLEHMQRLDLASERVSRALEMVGSNAESYDEIIRLVQKFEDDPLLLDVTLKALQLAEQNHDDARVIRYSDVLLHKVDAAQDKDQRRSIYSVVLQSVLLEADELHNLFKRGDIDLPFQEIVDSIESRITALPALEQAPYHLMFGELSQDKLEDSEKIYAYYELALKAGFMSHRSFDFLDTYYSRMGLNSQRFHLLQKKLEQAQGSERAVLLRELYYFDEDVSDLDKDKYALQILREDADDVGPIEERLNYYESQGDGAGIVAMMSTLGDYDFDRSVSGTLLRAGLQSIHSLGTSQRHGQLVQLLSRLRDGGEDPVELAQLSLSYLWDAEDKNYVRGSLALLVGRGIIPDISPNEMLAVLDDGKLKIELLRKLADGAKESDAALAFERQALELATDDPMMINTKLDIQRRLVTKLEFGEAELGRFLEESKAMGQEADCLGYLQSQLEIGSSDEHKNRVLALLESEIMALPEVESNAEVLRFITDLSLRDSSRMRFQWLEKFGPSPVLHTSEFLEFVLGDSDQWWNRALILSLIEYRLVLSGEDDGTRVLINAFICRLMAETSEENFRFFIDESAIANSLDNKSIRMAVDYSLLQKDRSSFDHFWWQSMIRVESKAEAIDFLRASRRYYSDFDAGREYYETLDRIITSHAAELKPDMAYEARLYFADHLAESNGSPKKVRSLLEGLYAERSEDSRIWAAMIAVYRELKAEGELFELLSKVLPALKEDPRPLKEYQISITGLEIEFDELTAKIEKIREVAVESAPPSELDHERAVTVISQERDHETLFSRPPEEKAERGFEHSLTFPPSDSVVVEGFSLADVTDIGKVPAKPELGVVGEIEGSGSPHFALDSENTRSFEEASPRAFPPAVNPGAGEGIMSFRLESTQTQARPLEFLSEGSPLPTPMEMGSPPPLPSMASAQGEFSQTLLSTPHAPGEFSQAIPSVPMVAGANSTVEIEEAPGPEKLSDSWKAVAKSAKPEPGLLQDLLAYPLPDLGEQIIGVQVAALVEDKIASLESYPHRVWRDPSAVKYELKWTVRMSRDQFHPGIKAPLARLLKALYPMFIQTFAHEMGISGVSDRLKIRGEEILKIRKSIDFNDEVFQRSNLRYYVAAFQESGYSLFHLPSIGDRFQFDFEKRHIYIDRNHYMAAPPSHIFHRLAFLLRAVSLDYFPFLNLSPSGEIYPFLMKCKRSLDQNDGMKRVLGLEKDPVRQLLSQAKDREHLAALFAEVGTLSADRISQSISHFIEQIYRLNLAETLDLIGLIETISGVDLANPRSSSFQRINQSSSAKSILAFAADLRFVKE